MLPLEGINVVLKGPSKFSPEWFVISLCVWSLLQVAISLFASSPCVTETRGYSPEAKQMGKLDLELSISKTVS
jgi:hypothetical protein